MSRAALEQRRVVTVRVSILVGSTAAHEDDVLGVEHLIVVEKPC
jgi:hypothetical protein